MRFELDNPKHIIDKYFMGLGERLTKEPQLSDVTYAVIKSSPAFKKSLLEFFEFEDNEPLEIFREFYLDEKSHPDFAILCENKVFIIELKIYDANDHFEQYSDSIKKYCEKYDFEIGGLGYLANYSIEGQYGFKTKTWEEFIDKLEVTVIENEEENELIKGYMKYIRRVCGIMKIDKINLENIKSLYQFNKLVEKIIKSPLDNDGYHCELYNLSKSFCETYSGYNFHINKNREEKKGLFSWFGIWYGEEDPCICISFDKNYNNENMFRKFKARPANDKSEWYIGYKNDGDIEICYEMTAEKYDNFNTAGKEEQEKMLRAFLNDVINAVVPYIN